VLLWVVAGLVVALAAVTLGALAFHAVRLARWTTEVERVPLHDHPASHSLECEEMSQTTLDGVVIRGWYLHAARQERCIVFVQGEEHHRNSPGIRSLELGRDLVARGFCVLLFDLRGRGESAGERGSAGNQELMDVLAALEYAKRKGFPPERTGVLGFSLGAALAIYAAIEEPRIGAVVCDSAFKDLLDDYKSERLWGVRVPPWLIVPPVRLAGRLLYRSDPGQMRPIKVVARLRQPILFIHSEADAVVPASDSVALHQRCGSTEKSLWLVPGAEHVQSYTSTRGEYVARVAHFFAERLA
jgi:alpha-beta hydrolase superfamily lysophospholipase